MMEFMIQKSKNNSKKQKNGTFGRNSKWTEKNINRRELLNFNNHCNILCLYESLHKNNIPLDNVATIEKKLIKKGRKYLNQHYQNISGSPTNNYSNNKKICKTKPSPQSIKKSLEKIQNLELILNADYLGMNTPSVQDLNLVNYNFKFNLSSIRYILNRVLENKEIQIELWGIPTEKSKDKLEELRKNLIHNFGYNYPINQFKFYLTTFLLHPKESPFAKEKNFIRAQREPEFKNQFQLKFNSITRLANEMTTTTIPGPPNQLERDENESDFDGDLYNYCFQK
ncbi:hypothetical protein CYY_000274 [Polysphondylium violaceum]|uniref:Uncharacterized protein n=1 Tax=Polysphondylium violaceum TaxID=133409 RepID=A0A8J4V944_9MYCE|nr:hypothetical protein CYY_000274 [Polysphondylium violaceum]